MNPSRPRLPPAPIGLVGASILVWGWQNGMIAYALPMAMVLEVARFTRWRWPVSDREFNNASDLCAVILAITVLYLFNEHGARGIFSVLAVLPFVVFPLMLVQVFSSAGHVRLSTLFMSLRKLDPARHPEAALPVDLTLPYFFICLLSASAGNHSAETFLALIVLLVLWLLAALRPRRYPLWAWLSVMVLVAGLATAGQRAVVWLQYRVEGYALETLDRYLWRFRDPDLATTAMGSIGRIKFSDRIVLRVKTDRPLQGMLLLREATYDTFGYGIWSNRRSEFTAIDPDITGTRWRLSGQRGDHNATISTYLSRDAAVVPLPHGTTDIRQVAATEISRSALGAVKMEIRRGWVRYVADYRDATATVDGAPTERDLYIAGSYRGTFDEQARQIGIVGLTPQAALARVRDHFASGFTYSLDQKQRYPRGKYLAEFLERTRSGHCELFATSTVLLLRAAGVPARYAVGYGIDEYSALEGQYVGRARHAHSWAMAWVDGQWQVVDTTPSVWAPEEARDASALQPLFDLWSWLGFRLARTQAEEIEEVTGDNTPWLWLLPPLVALLAWRLYFKERISVARAGRDLALVRPRPGLDSELFEVAQALESRGHRRAPGETLIAWLRRRDDLLGAGPLESVLGLHARHRFDPAGLTPGERQALATGARALLAGLGHRSRVT